MKAKLEAIAESVKARWVERDELVDAIVLSILTGADLLAIGKPGCAKSAVIKDFMSHLDMEKFSRQLNQYSTDKDLLGDINPKRFLESGIRIHEAPNTFLDADIAFVDEVFKGTKGARAALLEPLADRQFSENGVVRDLPLLSMLTASNELPSDKADAAFYSRLQMRILVKDIVTESGKATALWSTQPDPIVETITRSDIVSARREIASVPISEEAKETALRLFREMDELDISIDQRKRMKTMGLRLSLAQAQAWLVGHDEIRSEDLRVARFVFWSSPSQIEDVHNIVDKVCDEARSLAKMKFNELVEITGMKLLADFDDDQLTNLLNLSSTIRQPKFFCRLNGEERARLAEISESAARIVLGRQSRRG